MPAPGGTSDKLGNRYESLWAMDQLLRIVENRATDLVLEPLDEDESQGIEFRVTRTDGTREYWSCKRQVSGLSGWTNAKLCEIGTNGRSILGDLFVHMNRDATAIGVFASIQDASELRELCDHASNAAAFEARLNQNKDLKRAFDQRIPRLCGGDANLARERLTRLRVHSQDESRLRDQVDAAIRATLYKRGGGPIDPAGVRGHLAEFLLDNLGTPVDRAGLIEMLGAHDFLLADWGQNADVQLRLAQIVEAYTESAAASLINRQCFALPESENAFSNQGLPLNPHTLVVADAGGGKTALLADCAAKLRVAQVVVIALRFDELTEGILTPAELGTKLGLPASPVSVLANISKGNPAVLIIDQLDSVSVTSGRNLRLWALFELVLKEAQSHPGVHVVVGCRDFDLRHDHRMRKLLGQAGAYTQIRLKGLSVEQVSVALEAADVKASDLKESLREFLRHPLHLWMYLELASDQREGIDGEQSLLEAFWHIMEQRIQKRAGTGIPWRAALDGIIEWLNSHETLALPKSSVEGFGEAGYALVSERLLVEAGGGQYRFVHESLFDYAFARRFVARGESLHKYVVGIEQGLFVRAQVRQILHYLRRENREQYLRDLEGILCDSKVRFHLKRVVLQILEFLDAPTVEELAIINKFRETDPDGPRFANGTVLDRPGWFDVLDQEGHIKKALQSGKPDAEQSVISMIWRNTLQARSQRVAYLLDTFWRNEDTWRSYVKSIFRGGEFFHDRQLLDFFLARVADGTFDDFRPGIAQNDTWWDLLHASAKESPAAACEVIAARLDRLMSLHPPETKPDMLREALDGYGGNAGYILQLCWSGDPRAYTQHVLPRVLRMIEGTLEPENSDRLSLDKFFSGRSFGDDPHNDLGYLLLGLVIAMSTLAANDAPSLDDLTANILDSPSDTLTYLLLRAWSSTPSTYADQVANYLAADPRRLKVGYAFSGIGGGTAGNHVSRKAIRAATAECSDSAYQGLESAILEMPDEYERRHPKLLGESQLDLLTELPPSRMTETARSKLYELRTKFSRSGGGEPVASRVRRVPSPIPESAHDKMSDEHWLGAMRKYAETDGGADLRHERGGKRELAFDLQTRTTAEPTRFAKLGATLPTDLPSTYFDAILRGVSDYRRANREEAWGELGDACVQLIEKAHELEKRPCGSSICWLVQNWPSSSWPAGTTAIVAWYAINDPNPAEEWWNKSANNGRRYYDGDPLQAGINTVRGAAAEAIASLLESDSGRFEMLKPALASLSCDRSVAVRTVAIEALGAALAFDPKQALAWFFELAGSSNTILATSPAERFLHAVSGRHYGEVRVLLKKMLGTAIERPKSKRGFFGSVLDTLLLRKRKKPGDQAQEVDPNVDWKRLATVAATQVCLAAFETPDAGLDADLVRTGNTTARAAAATVYAHNVTDSVVGEECRTRLLVFLCDEEEPVRHAASAVFDRMNALPGYQQEMLLDAFLAGNPPTSALGRPFRALHESELALPRNTLVLVDKWISAVRGGEIGMWSIGEVYAVELVLRIYKQAENNHELRQLALDQIDKMERLGMNSLGRELKAIER